MAGVAAIFMGTPQGGRAMEQPQEHIEMLSGGRCLVRGTELGCDDVPGYLRDVLKLARGHLVRVRANPSLKLEYAQVRAIFDGLRKAGFSTYSAAL